MGLRREEQVEPEIGTEEEEFLLLEPAPEDQPDDAIDTVLDEELLLDNEAIAKHGFRWVGAGKALLITAGLAWVGFAVYLLFLRGFQLPALEQIPPAAAGLCAPLILLALLYMMLSRGSRGEASRFARITTRLRNEAEALDMRLAIVNQQLDTARQHMNDQATLLEHYGGSASVNLETAAHTLTQHVGVSAQQAELIERAGVALARQFGQLMEMMPDVEDRAVRITAALSEGSETLHAKVDKLEGRLDALTRLIDEARSRTTNATQSLTAQLMQIQDATRGASDEVAGLADISASRIASAVEDARNGLIEMGGTLDMRIADLGVMVKDSRIALENIGSNTITAYDGNISHIERRMRDLDKLVQNQSELIAVAANELSGQMGRLGAQFGELEGRSISGSEAITHALDELAKRTMQLDDALQSGNRTAEAIIARSESLLVALDASVQELDENHPAALARLDERVEQSRRLLTALTPEIEQIEAISSAILGRAKETGELLGGQGRQLNEWLENGEKTLGGCNEQITELRIAMEAADEGARRLADSAGPQLVATLMRVKEAADEAGERAKQALAHAIADATENLGDASEEALSQRLGEAFQARIEEISAVSDQAVRAAHAASDRLMRQLITIADTTASIEQRIAEADAAAERRDQDSFSRQSAALIEALNSAAIDVSKILSQDVSDTSWATYLKGDRGVFTRRAVRLVEAEDAQAILALYDDNEGFRDSVNRYIHDFEAMLRTILAARDGSSLGVILLSSDVGKLYVGLAQAIDRLKS